MTGGGENVRSVKEEQGYNGVWMETTLQTLDLILLDASPQLELCPFTQRKRAQ